jgi:integrase/recombinase XerC
MRALGERDILDATREDVETFLDHRNIGPRTRYSWLSHLHAFYLWATLEELTDCDPTARITRPKVRRPLPRPAPTEAVMCALAAGSPEQRTWVLLAAFQGLRCMEIAGLQREDVLETEGLLRVVHGKGGVERIMPLHQDVLDALLNLPMPRSGWIFRRSMGGPYKPDQMSTAFNNFLRDARVQVTAHQFRHWFGTHLYASTRDLRLVQEMLGHASPVTTTIYVAFDRASATRAVQDLSLEDAS